MLAFALDIKLFCKIFITRDKFALVLSILGEYKYVAARTENLD